MSEKSAVIIVTALLAGGYCFVQMVQSAELNDFKAVSANQLEKQCPQINSESSDTFYEWPTWRRCFYEFASLLF